MCDFALSKLTVISLFSFSDRICICRPWTLNECSSIVFGESQRTLWEISRSENLGKLLAISVHFIFMSSGTAWSQPIYFSYIFWSNVFGWIMQELNMRNEYDILDLLVISSFWETILIGKLNLSFDGYQPSPRVLDDSLRVI